MAKLDRGSGEEGRWMVGDGVEVTVAALQHLPSSSSRGAVAGEVEEPACLRS